MINYRAETSQVITEQKRKIKRYGEVIADLQKTKMKHKDIIQQLYKTIETLQKSLEKQQNSILIYINKTKWLDQKKKKQLTRRLVQERINLKKIERQKIQEDLQNSMMN